jgi:hypothetical protein
MIKGWFGGIKKNIQRRTNKNIKTTTLRIFP